MSLENKKSLERGPNVWEAIKNIENLMELSPSLRQELLEKAKNMLLEVHPSDQSSLRSFIQIVQTSFMHDLAIFNNPEVLHISPEYEVTIEDQVAQMNTKVSQNYDFTDLQAIGLNTVSINQKNSFSFLICITSTERNFWINLKLFSVVGNSSDERHRYLYIADRYVEPALRGKALGDQLLKIADGVAQDNNCEEIFATLVPEDEDNQLLLQKGHEKNGYHFLEGGRTAVKKLDRS